MKKDTFFQGCQWDWALPGFEPQNNYLLAQIIDKIPLKYRAVLTDDPSIQHDGFVMLAKLVQSLHPDTVERKLLAISDLAALEFSASDTMASCMVKVRGLANSLHGVTIDSFVTLLALSCLDPDLYPGIRASFLQADLSLLSLDLHGIGAQMEKEDCMKKLLPPSDQVRCTTTSRHPSQSSASPPGNDHKYPPKGPIHHQQIKDAVKAGYCIGC